MIVEVVAYNIESALRAQEGGADRIELCDNPGDGGTTPSAGCIEVVRQAVNIDLYPMIRPRGGDFCYSRYEFHAMKRDIAMCQKLSVDGVVFGILHADGTLDKKRCHELIERSRPLQVTCHRAFDMARDPFEALEDCIEVGFDRILTSGGERQSILGVDFLAQLVARAEGRIRIMAGSGVNAVNVGEIVEKTGVSEVHTSAATHRTSDMVFRNERIAGMGHQEGSEYQLRTVDVDQLRTLRARAEAAEKKRNA